MEMTVKKLMLLVCAALVAAGCSVFESGGDQPPRPMARIACVEVANAGVATRCTAATAAGWFSLIQEAQAARVIEAGTVSRAELIQATSRIDNISPVTWSGFAEARFDAGCNGEAEWVIVPLQRVDVEAGNRLNISVGGACGDMPTGQRRLIATAYGADQATVVDRVEVRFTLTE